MQSLLFKAGINDIECNAKNKDFSRANCMQSSMKKIEKGLKNPLQMPVFELKTNYAKKLLRMITQKLVKSDVVGLLITLVMICIQDQNKLV